MVKRLLVMIISFLLISQQVVLSSQYSNSRSSSISSSDNSNKNPINSKILSNKKKRSDEFFDDEDEMEDSTAEVTDSDLNRSSSSAMKRRKYTSSSNSLLFKDQEQVKDRSFEDEAFSDFESESSLFKEKQDIMEGLANYRRTFLRFYGQNRSPYRIITDRSKLFQSFYCMAKENESSWYNGLIRPFIIFEGETGVDQGGLTSEAIEILIENFIKDDSQRIIAENFCNTTVRSSILKSRCADNISDFSEALFHEISSGIYVPNTKYPPKVFKFVGSILALAFNLDISVGIEFLPAFYRTITGEQTSIFVITEDELKYVDNEIYTSLVALKKMDDLKSLELEFMGNEVTKDNLKHFIRHETNFHCFLKYKQHLDSLKEGFFSSIDSELFDDLHLNSNDLLEIMRGDVVLTYEDYLKHVNVSKLTDSNSKAWIFDIIKEFSNEERLLLFKFITARCNVPFKGLRNLITPISFASVYLPTPYPLHLPAASTCGSLMKIPVYRSKNVLKEKLLMAINSCNTFDLE